MHFFFFRRPIGDVIDPRHPAREVFRMKKRKLRVGVIAAAGKGTRAYPRTSFIPKPMFRFQERTILEKNAEIQFKVLGVRKLYVIVGHLAEIVVEEVEAIRAKYPDREIEAVPWTQNGLASDVAQLRDRIDEDFALILGDEFYHETDHAGLKKTWSAKSKAAALIAVWKTDLVSHIRKNYSVELKGDKVLKLIEKPRNPPNNLAGLGTYIFSADFFDFFDRTEPSKRSGVVELTDVIDVMARETGEVFARDVGGLYFNINSLADYYAVNYFLRSQSFSKNRVSLVVPSFNNAATLPDVLNDFKDVAHEIIVVDMGSEDGTAEAAAKIASKRRGAMRVIREESGPAGPFQARAIYAAMEECKGDLIVLTMADGSFRAHDLPKLMEYVKDCDMAVGTRTTRQMIEQGSNLRPLYRWLNVFLGKLVEVLWWGREPRFTDIGCIYRAVWKDAFVRMADDLKAEDKTFSLEMMIEMMRYHMRCIEIPVSYYQAYDVTAGPSKGELWRYFFSTLRMIVTRRLRKG